MTDTIADPNRTRIGVPVEGGALVAFLAELVEHTIEHGDTRLDTTALTRGWAPWQSLRIITDHYEADYCAQLRAKYVCAVLVSSGFHVTAWNIPRT